MKDDYDPDSDDIKGNLRNKNIGKSVKKVKNRKKKKMTMVMIVDP